MDKVSKKFGGLQALREVDLHVEKGKIVGLIGPNGAGKTTLFNLITGFLKPDGGSVHFQNKEITGLSAHQICQTGIARTFQIAKPFEDLTVFKTVTIGALVHSPTVKEAEKKTEALLHRLRLEDKKEKLGRSLTVVERKRLELARALASEPKLLLIDEVIAGLNPTEVDEISEILQGLVKSGITILMIEHIMRAILSLTDKVFVLDAGAKIAEGDPKNLLNDPLVLEAYIGKEDPHV
ncbi:MAG TPA: ABC transporter ATP-binding protein [Thermodesulfobacteriota bacterium]|nr:ABC transporter ATP-binding protein [Thermodesulfobacteriota bacterium]